MRLYDQVHLPSIAIEEGGKREQFEPWIYLNTAIVKRA